MNSRAGDKIIVALDVPTREAAVKLVTELLNDVGFFKIGLQLYIAQGPGLIRSIAFLGPKIFLDLKLHDIPNTVAKAVESAGNLGVKMLSIHLSGGSEMIRAAVGARQDNLSILGVTVLTSTNEEMLRELGVDNKIDDQVLRLANLGVSAGVQGIVASPHEVKKLRAEFGDAIKIITPGVRPSWAEPGDQKRFMTPREAIDAGADYLVIGRPITADANPRAALTKILDELQS
jgi:orotidine-5'-phosphate decarboxylase